MFTVSYDRRFNVLLVRFAGVYSSEDITDWEVVALDFASRRGPAHVIRDLGSVDAIAVPASKIVQRGQQPPLFVGYKRVTIVPRSDLYETAHLFGIHQEQTGISPPILVATLDEAFRSLDLVDPHFEPVELQA
jgi:hypothetical protein